MIRFFRKIRQEVLSKNQINKYLIYAIGEIVLVVLGILLALQINTWNQARVNKQTEKEYYRRLLADVLLDQELISKQITVTQDRLKGANELIKSIQENNEMEDIARSIGRAVSRSDFGLKPTQTTFEEIKSSGNLHLIKDYEFKKQLDSYYAFMNGLLTTINNNASHAAPRMFEKEDIMSTGLYHLAKRQNGFDPSVVNIKELDKLTKLTSNNKLVLLNDGVFYAAMASRNLQHFKVLEEKIEEMKIILDKKCGHHLK